MKKFFIFLTVVILSLGIGCSRTQNSSLPNDTKLEKLAQELPKNWSINFDGATKRLSIKRAEKAWVVFENKINADMSLEERRAFDYTKQGKETVCQIILRAEDRWTREQEGEAKIEQEGIYNQINRLPKDFNIVHLLDKFLSSKGEDIFIGRTTAEKKRITDYQTKKAQLESQLPHFPDYTSEKYSLFLEGDSCKEDEFQSIYPKEAAVEIFEVHQLLQKTLE